MTAPYKAEVRRQKAEVPLSQICPLPSPSNTNHFCFLLSAFCEIGEEQMLTTKLAIRNIFRNRRRSAMTLLVIVFGAIALILFGGYKAITFRGLRESTIRNRIGHLQIYKHGYLSAE